MKKLILKSAFIIVLLTISVIFIQSCCKETFRISSKVVSTEVWTMVGQGRRKIDTIKSNFILSTVFEQILISLGRNYSMINSAYAMHCNENYLNRLIPKSFVLTIDKPFIYYNDTISTNKNLITLPNVIPQIDEGGFAEVRFPQEFIDNAKFQPGYYKFILNGLTNDSIKLINCIVIYIRL